MIHTLCTRTAPSVSERGRETVPCKDWPSATASGGYGLDKGLSPGPRLPPRDRRWGLFGRADRCASGPFNRMRRRQLRSHATRHGCGNLSQDRVSVLFGSTESEALSVAFAIHLDDGGVMDQSIDGRRRHGGIGKDRVTRTCSQPLQASRKWYRRCGNGSPAMVTPRLSVTVKSDSAWRPGSWRWGK